MNINTLILLAFSAILIAVGDAFLKKSAVAGNFNQAMQSPWFIGAVILYFLQILLVVYLFFSNLPLGIVGTGLTFVYAIVMVLIGYFFFSERFSLIQLVGVGLGIVGVFLMTYKI
ncbi:MAG TPA: hypothetical protein VGQ87_01785 [Patescibacteria group bacterium]|jgi:drug/metabolite transporter (DMT)-like permease|nr:hypothetical protein [Patescibacteria group bacterium]